MPKRPGLQMIRLRLDDLPPLAEALAALPPGYGLRTYRPGDEPAWAAIMNTGQMGEWDVERTREKLTGCPYPQFDPDGLFFVTYTASAPDAPSAPNAPNAPSAADAADAESALPVGSACAWLRDPAETEMGILHMVGVLPEHRGRRLSYPLCLAVLHRFRGRGLRRAFLNTGDWRLGAVKTYLRLGFQPYYKHPLHPQQWREVVEALGWREPLVPVLDPAFSGKAEDVQRAT